MTPILELRGITKRFPGVLANDHIDLTLEQGEVHALLGENGAGKTTLMNILYGLYQPSEGEIYIRGQRLIVESPSDAIAAGIGMVHQHFMLIPVFTVTENVMLGAETLLFERLAGRFHKGLLPAFVLRLLAAWILVLRLVTGGMLDRAAAAKRVRQISKEYELEVDPLAYMADLAVGVQQRVEIIKLLYRQADILVFDEPTAVLTPQEADELFKIMRSLVASGKSIIFITHKLREVLEVADRITVLRRGAVVGTTKPAEANRNKLAAMMVGREVQLEVEKKPPKVGEVVLEVSDLVVADERRQVAVDRISFEVRAGEVLGVAGVQGNGQTELVQALTGLRPALSGTIRVLGKDVTRATPREVTALGTAHVPEDRQRDGLVLAETVSENLMLCTYYQPPFARGVVLQRNAILETATGLIEQFDIRTPGPMVLTGSLSGGNQQKVIVAREFSRPIHLMIASQPTRGLDVGSIEYIHKRIVEKRDAGCAVLLVSPELDEIIELSDRIAVIYRGKIVAVIPGEKATKEYVGLLMAGVSVEQAGEPTGKRTVEVTF
jgi:simple sugar transport system ATP-binding protein